MRRAQPKEKERRKIVIPEDLREALREAKCRIEESERDPNVRVDYGDAIQCGALVGGQVGSSNRPFEFDYSVEGEHSSPTRWHLAFHPLATEDIAYGCQTELNLYCCRSLDCKYKSTDPDDLCDCDYVDDPYFGNFEPSGVDEALRRIGLSEITQLSSRDEIEKMLGNPQESGGDEKRPPLGYIWPWIKYQRVDCQLRFEFQRSGAIRRVSILDPNWKPGS